MDPDAMFRLMGSEKADVIYSDPPWGQGNLRYWQTMNWKMTGQPRVEVGLTDFLHRILGICAERARGVVLIEYGVRWRDELQEMARQHGLHLLGRADPLYRGGGKLLPLDLHVFSVDPSMSLSPSYFQRINGTHGFATVKAAAFPLARPGGILLDPCCGMGYSARAAIETGMSFRGNELNAKRLRKTIDRLEKAVERERKAAR